MCGFLGALGTDLPLKAVRGAAGTIAHRGPHGCTVVSQPPFMLVAYRLAIVPPEDTKAAITRDGSYCALNGELYELPPSQDGVPSTDTERLAAWLEANRDIGSLRHLRGLFAFCHYNRRRLVLARDRFGIKPLYYAFFRGGLVFASEIKAILALPGFSRDPDQDVLSSFSVLGHSVFPGRTPFFNIKALPPGHSCTATADGALSIQPFCEKLEVPPAGDGRSLDPEELSYEVERLLGTAMARAMRHDPNSKALFFSGGLDSTLLLELARSEGAITPWTLTDREEADDLQEARKITSAMGIPLREDWLTPERLSREIVHYAWHFEHPIAGGTFDLLGGVAFHALAREIAKEHRVAFCGEGADELFMGYHRIHMEPGLQSAALRDRLPSASPALREWLAQQGLLSNGQSLARALRGLALHEGLSEYHLPSVDRSGMAFGLEIRPPYLDEELFSFAASLDESMLIDRTERWTKLPLRALMRRRAYHTALERAAERRKRAMPSAVETVGAKLERELCSRGRAPDRNLSLAALLEALFHYLHIDPGCPSVPDFSLHTFAAEVGTARRL